MSQEGPIGDGVPPKASKAQAVRDYLKAHPKAARAEVVAALAEREIVVSVDYVSSVKTKAKKRGRPRKRSASRRKVSTKGGGRRPGPRPYPVMTFEDALPLGEGVMEHGAGHPMKRVTLLKKLGLKNNQQTKNLITNSNKYGITQGAHDAEEISLTPEGADALNTALSPRQRAQAQFDLAVREIGAFNRLYERFSGGRMPAPEVMRDALGELDTGDRAHCVDIFVSNAKKVGLLQTLEGAETLLSIEELLDRLPASSGPAPVGASQAGEPTQGAERKPGSEDFEKLCFFIAPIGEPGDEQRKHSDMILSSFIARALDELGLEAIRADKIEKPGMITGQVIRYILNAKLVIADLSYLNPNVLYELSLRHATGKPTVHVVRKGEKIPFDLKDYRTVEIAMDCKYDLVAKLDTYRAEIANKARKALEDDISRDNPILAFCPRGRFVVR